MHIEDLLTIPEAAEVIGVSRATIYYWMKTGALAYFKKGAQRLVRLDALQLTSKMVEATGKSRRKGESKNF